MNPIKVEYSGEKLRILVEEFITMQNSDFTLKDLCSYVLYWAKEEGKTEKTGLYESNELHQSHCESLNRVLKQIICEGRLKVDPSNKSKFVKTVE